MNISEFHQGGDMICKSPVSIESTGLTYVPIYDIFFSKSQQLPDVASNAHASAHIPVFLNQYAIMMK